MKKPKYLLKDLNYFCRNTAFHDYHCCDTCWNGHPEAKEGEMFLLNRRCNELLREAKIYEATCNGFTEKQARWLVERL